MGGNALGCIQPTQLIGHGSNHHLRDCVCFCQIALSQSGNICSSGRLAVKNNLRLKKNHCNLYAFSSLSLQRVSIETKKPFRVFNEYK